MKLLKASQITKSYPGVPLLSQVSLELNAGESIAICGRSGEGKTTLLHILGTLEEAGSGHLEIKGQTVTRLNCAKLRSQHIGFVFQTYNLLDDFTTLDNVLLPSLIARRPQNKAYGLSLLRLVGLEERAQFLAKNLSGGEKQRAAIARALCNDPDLILADEPSGNLDQENAQKISRILFSLVKEQKKGLILVTHDTELASHCDRRYILSKGVLG